MTCFDVSLSASNICKLSYCAAAVEVFLSPSGDLLFMCFTNVGVTANKPLFEPDDLLIPSQLLDHLTWPENL